MIVIYKLWSWLKLMMMTSLTDNGHGVQFRFVARALRAHRWTFRVRRTRCPCPTTVDCTLFRWTIFCHEVLIVDIRTFEDKIRTKFIKSSSDSYLQMWLIGWTQKLQTRTKFWTYCYRLKIYLNFIIKLWIK